MRQKTRHWDRSGNGGLSFTGLGFGPAPIGNLAAASAANPEALRGELKEAGLLRPEAP